MFTIFDYLKYNNIPYSELPEGEDKNRLEKFAKKIEDEGLKDLILSFTPAHTFNARNLENHPKDYISGLPQDLTNKLILLWLNLDNPEYHLPANS